jgi:hypothetical protein
MSFSIGRNLAPKGLIVLAITLGGRDPESYIWLAMAEIQPGHFGRLEAIGGVKPSGGLKEDHQAAAVLGLWDSGVWRFAAPSAGDTPV